MFWLGVQSATSLGSWTAHCAPGKNSSLSGSSIVSRYITIALEIRRVLSSRWFRNDQMAAWMSKISSTSLMPSME